MGTVAGGGGGTDSHTFLWLLRRLWLPRWAWKKGFAKLKGAEVTRGP